MPLPWRKSARMLFSGVNIIAPSMTSLQRGGQYSYPVILWQSFLSKAPQKKSDGADTTLEDDKSDVDDDDNNSSEDDEGNSQDISLQAFKNNLLGYFTIGSVASSEDMMREAQETIGVDRHDFARIFYSSETVWFQELSKLVPTLLILGSFWFIERKLLAGLSYLGSELGSDNKFDIGTSHFIKIDKNAANKVYFKDVAGCDEARQEIEDFVHFLKNPKKYKELGAKIPTHALLVGPPETGKTLLAKAIAGESGVPFFSISGSEFIELYHGVGPSRVRSLFAEARKCAPSIIFIDEIDAFGRAHPTQNEKERTLNHLLVETIKFWGLW